MQNQSDIKVKQIKDYIKNPKPNGYRSYHMLVEIPVFLSDHVQPVTVEVQLRTTGMDLWASIEHKIYYKSDADVPDSVLDRLKQCAQVLSILDDVEVSYVSSVKELGEPDLVILPGTKNTMEDLLWLRQSGLEAAVLKLAGHQTPVVGICGGYQMLGETLRDPEGTENGTGEPAVLRGMGPVSYTHLSLGQSGCDCDRG